MTSLAATFQWPTLAQLWAVLTLQTGYNTRVVMIGVALLGFAVGIVGTFAVLRRRAMMSDTLSHATLPGIGLAFLVAFALGLEGRSLPVLLTGAAVAGVIGVLIVQFLAHRTRLPEDAAMGAVLSVFFGLGFVILSYIQTLRTGAEGGITKFIYGQTAAMSAEDAWLIGAIALGSALAVGLLFKEFRLVCFDPDFAEAQGWPVARIDLLMMTLVIIVTVVGLQAVGLILIIALVVIPAAAARFWTDRLIIVTVLAGLIGAASGYIGAALSALLPRFPAGGIIVLVAGMIFLFSLFLAPRRGVIAGSLRRLRLRLRIESQHALRAIFERAEARGVPLRGPAPVAELRIVRSWSAPWRRLVLWALGMRGLLLQRGGDVQLTQHGAREARRITRNHRLWEAYLVRHAELAPTHVDQSADFVEHVLDQDIVARLEAQLENSGRLPQLSVMPDSVHP